MAKTALMSCLKNYQKPPATSIYAILPKVKFIRSFDPKKIMENVFDDSNKFEHTHKNKINELCGGDGKLIQFILAKMYCLKYTPKPFQKEIEKKIRELSKLEDTFLCFKKFKEICTFATLSSQIDEPVEKKTVERQVKFKVNNVEKIKSMIEHMESKKAMWKRR